MKIEQATLDFLADLHRNNYRDWFQSNRPRYEAAKENVLAVAAELIEAINRFDPSLGYPDPRKLLFRINRDTRFSNNKDPYKSHLGVILNAEGKTASLLSGYYLHVEAGGSFLSCGAYMLPPEELRAVRTEIDRQWERFHAIMSAPGLRELFGDLSREDQPLSRVPRGFDALSPAAEVLKLRHFYVWRPLSDSQIVSPGLVSEAAACFEQTKLLNDFLNEAIRGAR